MQTGEMVRYELLMRYGDTLIYAHGLTLYQVMDLLVNHYCIGDETMLSKLCWCFWQLFPCTYRTYYGEKAADPLCRLEDVVRPLLPDRRRNRGHSCHALDDPLQMIESACREAGCRESCCR